MYKTILVPLDGSKRAEQILPYIEAIASMRESTVILLQVVEAAALTVGPSNMLFYEEKDASNRALSSTKAYLEACADDLRARGIAAKYIVEYGIVVQRILEVAEREKAELIAMASHGRTGLARVFYGSVAAGVMQQTDRPLLLIRSAGS
ncbi:MAG: universal stress protein [Caldilineaceae bacterium]|nr:universal stress protein [Caldilineaceae bacterium]